MDNAVINNIKNMLNVRISADTQDSAACFELANPPIASETTAENLKPLHEFIRTHGEDISEIIEKKMEFLQENFVQILHDQLEKGRISLDMRLVLTLSPQGYLIIEGEGDFADAVQEILSLNPVLSILFAQIRARAVMLQGLEHLQSGLGVSLAPQGGEEEPILPQYKMCLKGTLSHFYLG